MEKLMWIEKGGMGVNNSDIVLISLKNTKHTTQTQTTYASIYNDNDNDINIVITMSSYLYHPIKQLNELLKIKRDRSRESTNSNRSSFNN